MQGWQLIEQLRRTFGGCRDNRQGSVTTVSAAPIKVIVPAYNEEAVIVRTLSALLANAKEGEFDVIVACNGCHDRTADRVRQTFKTVSVIELTEASKTAAINAGLSWADAHPVLLLDADIEITTESARALVAALDTPGKEAAIGFMRIDLQGASWCVRSFYKIWSRHPYLAKGKFAAAIALSRTAVARIGQLPSVIADDGYLRRLFPVEQVAVVDEVSFDVRVPRTLSALIRVRSRVHRGNVELGQLDQKTQGQPQGQPQERVTDLLRDILTRPALWPHVPVYGIVTLAARVMARTGSGAWRRDLTTRQPARTQ